MSAGSSIRSAGSAGVAAFEAGLCRIGEGGDGFLAGLPAHPLRLEAVGAVPMLVVGGVGVDEQGPFAGRVTVAGGEGEEEEGEGGFHLAILSSAAN